MRKRPTLKGRGVDIFLKEQPEQAKKVLALGKEKATFYLPPLLLASLDDTWFKLRKNNRKIRKSDIVRAALEKFLTDSGEGNKNSIHAKQLDS